MKFFISCFKRTTCDKKRIIVEAPNLKMASDRFFGINEHISFDDIDFFMSEKDFDERYDEKIKGTFWEDQKI